MNKLLLCLLCLCVCFLAVVPCVADTTNGVLCESPVVNLPQDSSEWYISVVGNANDASYQKVLRWFDTNEGLKGLKDQVHFCPVTSGTPVYQERYAKNCKGLPTVRVQKPSGQVVYEASGKNLPMTAEGLYGAIAGGVNSAQGITILPWRRNMEKRGCPGPCPKPEPKPNPSPDADPAPQPLDNEGAPEIDESEVGGLPAAAIVGIAIASVVIAAGIGLAVQWKKTYASM